MLLKWSILSLIKQYHNQTNFGTLYDVYSLIFGFLENVEKQHGPT